MKYINIFFFQKYAYLFLFIFIIKIATGQTFNTYSTIKSDDKGLSIWYASYNYFFPHESLSGITANYSIKEQMDVIICPIVISLSNLNYNSSSLIYRYEITKGKVRYS